MNTFEINIVYVLMYIVAWSISLKKYKKRTSWFGPGSYLMLSYMVFGIFSLVYLLIDLSTISEIKLFPFIYLFLSLYIASYPVLKYEESKDVAIQKPNNTLLIGLICFCFLGAIAKLICSLPTIKAGISIMMVTDSGALDNYQQMDDYYQVIGNNSSNLPFILRAFFILNAYIADIPILLLMYYLTLSDRNKILVYTLVFDVLVMFFTSVALGNRTGIVEVAFQIIILFLFFYNYYDDRLRKSLYFGFAIFLSLVIISSTIITISRFSFSSTYTSPLESVIDYAGQGNVNFNRYCLDAGGTRHGDRTMSMLKSITEEKIPDMEMVRKKYSNMKIDDSIFSTFIGDFVLDFGPYVAFILILVSSLVFTKITKPREGFLSFSQLIWLFFIMTVCSVGGMYLFPYAYMRGQRIIGYLILSILFYTTSSNSSARSRALV